MPANNVQPSGSWTCQIERSLTVNSMKRMREFIARVRVRVMLMLMLFLILILFDLNSLVIELVIRHLALTFL